MWLTPEEIDAVYDRNPNKRKPKSVHLSLSPGASRDQALAEFDRSQERILAGDFDVVKNYDKGTHSFRGKYKSLREMNWSSTSSFFNAAWSKVKNIWKTGKI